MSVVDKKLVGLILESLFPESTIEAIDSSKEDQEDEGATFWRVLQRKGDYFVVLAIVGNIELSKVIRINKNFNINLKVVLMLQSNKANALEFRGSFDQLLLYFWLIFLGFVRREKFYRYDVCVGGVEFHNSRSIDWLRRAKYSIKRFLGMRGADLSLTVYSRSNAPEIGLIRDLYIRDRGSIITVKCQTEKGKAKVYRASHSTSIGRIERNYNAIKVIKSRVSGATAAIVPEIEECKVSHEKKLYIEDYFEGVVGWKGRSDPRVYRRAVKEAINAIISLQDSMPLKRVKLSKYFHDYVLKDMRKLSSDMVSSLNIGEKVDKIISNYGNVEVLVALNHGDYGLGNIIINPTDGEVQGIIDWDTYIENELFGLDVANLSLQEAFFFKLDTQGLTYNYLSAVLDRHLGLISSRPVKSYLTSIRDILLQASIIRFVIRDISFKNEDHQSLSVYRALIDVI